MHFGETEAERLLAATVPIDSVLPEARVTPARVAATQDAQDSTRDVVERDSTMLTPTDLIKGVANRGSGIGNQGIVDRLRDGLRAIRDRIRRGRHDPAAPQGR